MNQKPNLPNQIAFTLTCQTGFTLPELMVFMLVSTILTGMMMLTFTGQSKGYNSQEELSHVQQNLRAATAMMIHDIRMAGYDPDGDKNTGFTVTNDNRIKFSYLDRTNNNQKETIEYSHYDSYDDNGGKPDAIKRTVGAGNGMPLAENIEQLRFEYLLSDGTWKGNLSATDDPDDIRAVKIMILGKTKNEVKSSYTPINYAPPIEENGQSVDWEPPTGDRKPRQLVSLIVYCRNQAI